MGMPYDLALVRHGLAEGNAAKKASERGDHSAYSEAYRARPGWQWRLMDVGRSVEAPKTGTWIRANIAEKFNGYFVSPYLRPKETAALLGLADAEWRESIFLRERHWGVLDAASYEEKMHRYKEEIDRKNIQGLLWAPTGGESMAEACIDTKRFIDMLWQDFDGKRVIVVSHGERMWTFRFLLERMTLERYEELDRSSNKLDRIHNCQVLHYTRRNPENQEDIAPHYKWMRSVCPWDMSLSRNVWEEIIYKKYSNEELLAQVEKYPRLVNG